MKTQHYLLLIICACLYACQAPSTDAQVASDPYVYYDSNKCLHLDKHCKQLHAAPKHMQYRKSKADMHRDIDNGWRVGYTCTKCVSEPRYQALTKKPR